MLGSLISQICQVRHKIKCANPSVKLFNALRQYRLFGSLIAYNEKRSKP